MRKLGRTESWRAVLPEGTSESLPGVGAHLSFGGISRLQEFGPLGGTMSLLIATLIADI